MQTFKDFQKEILLHRCRQNVVMLQSQRLMLTVPVWNATAASPGSQEETPVRSGDDTSAVLVDPVRLSCQIELCMYMVMPQ